MERRGSAIWGGATIGLVVGLILGLFVGTYWTTVLYAAGIGAALGVVANILGWLSDRPRNRAATQPTVTDHWRSLLLHQAETVLRQSSPADFETTQNAASMCVAVVANLEDGDGWRAGYDSLESFYATHEAQHPDIRLYAAVWREIPIEDPNDPPNGTGAEIVERIAADRRTVPDYLFETSEDYHAQAASLLETSEDILRNSSPANFERTPDAYELVYMVEEGENWRAGYDSLESFYAAHEERHPEVRQYAARARKFLDDREGVLRESSPADFETKPYAAIDCIAATHAVADREVWRSGYDSLESFYGAYEARHPDIRVYAAVYREGYDDSARGDPSLALGRTIAQRIAAKRS
jgi:hypothetical protein